MKENFRELKKRLNYKFTGLSKIQPGLMKGKAHVQEHHTKIPKL